MSTSPKTTPAKAVRAPRTPLLQQRPLASVSIDHETYLLPFALAQQLVGLMAHAVRCHDSYSRDARGLVYWQDAGRERPTVEMRLVQPEQVLSGPPAETTP